MKGTCCICGKKRNVVFYKQYQRITLNICNECLQEENNKQGFRIVCDVCKRQLCDFQFTEEGDIVVYCRSCGQMKMIYKSEICAGGRNFI